MGCSLEDVASSAVNEIPELIFLFWHQEPQEFPLDLVILLPLPPFPFHLQKKKAILKVFQLQSLRVKYCRPQIWKPSHSMSSRLPPETSVLTVFSAKVDLVLFTKDGLINTHFHLLSLDQEWSLLSRSLSLKVSKDTRSGWYVSF